MRDVMDDEGYRFIFDGKSLDGWRSIPRVYGALQPGGPQLYEVLSAYDIYTPPDPERHPAKWHVDRDGTLIGEQGTPGYGGYLITQEEFGDFDLALEAKPDWPADTGVMLRRDMDDWAGIQVLIDHRPSGGIGGFFGNGLASFSAVPFAIDAVLDEQGRPTALKIDDPATSAEPVTQDKIDRLEYAASADDFLKVWKWSDWNELRVRCVGGALPRVTTWINGLKIAEVDLATLNAPDFIHADIADHLGERGRIALEVHDNDGMFGESRWGTGAQCRWRNIRVRPITS